MSFGFGGGSGGQIRYTITVDDTQAIQKLQSVGQQMQSLGTSVVGSQQDVSDAMQQQGQAVTEATKAHESYGSTLKQNVLGIALAASSIISLVQQYTSLKRAQNTLEKAQNVEKGQVIAIAKQRLKLAEAVKKHGENSKEARAELEKLNLLESKHATQVERIDLMQQSLSSRMADFAVNIVPSVIGIVSGLTQTFDILGKGRTGRGGIGGVLLSLGKFALPLAAIGFAAFAVKTNLFGFRDALDGVGKAIGKAIPGIKPFLDAIRNVGVVLGLVPGDAKKAQAELKNFAGGIIAWGQDIIKQVSAVFDKLKSGDVVGAIAGVKKMAVNAFKSIGVDIRKEVAKFKKDPIQYVTDVAVDLLNKIGDITINGITLRQWKAALPILIKSEIADAKGNVLVGLGNVVVDIARATLGPDAANQLAKIPQMIRDSTYKSGLTLASPMKRGLIYDVLDAISPGVGTQVQNWASTTIGEVKVAWKQFIIGIKNNLIQAGMKLAAPSKRGLIYDVLDAIVPDVGTQLQNWASTTIAYIKIGWKQFVIGIKNYIISSPAFAWIKTATDILGKAVSGLSDIDTWFDTYILTPLETGWNSLVTGYQTFVKDPKNTIFAWLKDAADILGTIPDLAASAFKWLDDKIGNPLRKGWANFVAGIQGYASGQTAEGAGGVEQFPNTPDTRQQERRSDGSIWERRGGGRWYMVQPPKARIIKTGSGADIPFDPAFQKTPAEKPAPTPTKDQFAPTITGAQKAQTALANLANQGANSISILANAIRNHTISINTYLSKTIATGAQKAQTALANFANQGANAMAILQSGMAQHVKSINTYLGKTVPSAAQKSQTALANLANEGANSMSTLQSGMGKHVKSINTYLAKTVPVAAQKSQTSLANLANQGSKSVGQLAKNMSNSMSSITKSVQGAQKAVISLVKSIGNLKSKSITITTHFRTTGQIQSFQHGGSFTTHGPQLIMVGDNPGGREKVNITPGGGGSGGGFGGGNIVVELTNVLADREIVRTYKRKLGENQYRFGPR